MIRFQAIQNAGFLDNERVVFRITESGQIGNQLLFCNETALVEGARHLQSRIVNAFWFPDQLVEKGDLAVVYTKKGFVKVKENEDGNKSVFFYMNKDHAIWSRENSALVTGTFSAWKTNYINLNLGEADVEPL